MSPPMPDRTVRRAERARRRAIREVERAIADGCVLDEVRSFDPVTGDVVYSVACLAKEHAHIKRCPTEHEMFRRKRDA